MTNNKYIGKTNKELIIETIGHIERLEEKLTECRPVCFKSENEIIEVKRDMHNFKFIISTIAILATAFVNIALFVYKKLKGG